MTTRRVASKPATPNVPRPVRVQAAKSTPIAVDGKPVEAVLEDWLVEDKWWAERALRRRYWELITVTGRRLVIFHDLVKGSWYKQAA
jgi:hypothetical protein